MPESNEIQNYLEKIASKEGITPEEVYSEMSLAISEALQDEDPLVREYWESIPSAGDVPTPEEFITFITSTLPKA